MTTCAPAHPMTDTLPLFGETEDARFDRQHPGVYSTFAEIAEQTRRAGFEHYSARTIIHVMRHHRAISMGPGGEFKIDNRVSPYLGRRLVRERPEFAGFFEFRKSREDE